MGDRYGQAKSTAFCGKRATSATTNHQSPTQDDINWKHRSKGNHPHMTSRRGPDAIRGPIGRPDMVSEAAWGLIYVCHCSSGVALMKRIYYFYRARSREGSTKQPRHVWIRGAAGRPGAHDLAGVAPRWSVGIPEGV